MYVEVLRLFNASSRHPHALPRRGRRAPPPPERRSHHRAPLPALAHPRPRRGSRRSSSSTTPAAWWPAPGAWPLCEELAAFAPLLADPRAVGSDVVGTRLAAIEPEVFVRALSLDGCEALLCGRGGGREPRRSDRPGRRRLPAHPRRDDIVPAVAHRVEAPRPRARRPLRRPRLPAVRRRRRRRQLRRPRRPPSAEASASAGALGAAGADGALPVADVPEVRDTGDGRATAALRAVLQAYGIAFDAAAILERECKVDDDGASIDDLEDVAVKYGLEAGQRHRPRRARAPPRGEDAAGHRRRRRRRRRAGLRRRLAPRRRPGRRSWTRARGAAWVPRAELQKSLHVHEMTMPADEYREAMAARRLRATPSGRGWRRSAPRRRAREALLDRAAADPGWRGLGALDAAIRELAAAPPAHGGAGRRSARGVRLRLREALRGRRAHPAGALVGAARRPNGPAGRGPGGGARRGAAGDRGQGGPATPPWRARRRRVRLGACRRAYRSIALLRVPRRSSSPADAASCSPALAAGRRGEPASRTSAAP